MSVRKDKKRDVWVIDFYFTTKDGTQKRYRKDSQATTKRDALAEEARLGANCAVYGSPFAPAEVTLDGAITFEKATDEFRVGLAKVELKSSTRHGYEEILKGILLPRFGKTRIGDIDYLTVQKLDAEMVERECSASRRRNVQCVLRTVLGVAVDCGRMKEMPKLPDLPTVGRTINKVMTFAQLSALIECASDAAVLPLSLAALCGLRSGEIRALRKTHLDLAQGRIIVEESVSHGEIDSPKSGHQRMVPIPAQLLGLLRLMKRQGKIPQEYICVTPEGLPWGETGLSQAFERAAKKAGIKGFRMHDLRHFWCTMMLKSGAPVHVVKTVAGHENLATTSRYSHASEADALEAVARFSTVIDAGGSTVNDQAGFELGNIWETEPENDDPHGV